jgi:ribose 5-phosphate isomerase A
MQLLIDTGIPISDLNATPIIDIAIDGADEINPNLDCIKGGGACQTQEKAVAVNAKKFVVIADYRKQSKMLGTEWKKGVPIEVLPIAYVPVMQSLEKMGGKPVLRMAGASKAGPIVTDNGGFVVDCDFGRIEEPRSLHAQIKGIVGVVETGIFPDMAVKAFFGLEDGTVETWTKEK